VKRIFTHQFNFKLLILGCVLFTTSCSSIWSHIERQSTVSNDPPPKSSTVSREQYDEIVRKYQELLANSKTNSKSNEKSESTLLDPNEKSEISKVDEQVKPQAATATNIDPSELVNHIDQTVPDAKNVEGVDVLSPNGPTTAKKEEHLKSGPPIPESMGVQQVNNTDDVDEQITKLREANELVKVGKFENALTILKELENSKEKQIVVRAKIMLGDLLFGQGEFDLAMQVFEEVIKKYAFSGYVLKALGKLVACSEKLKLPEKQAKYYSLLHDFFEAT
jgi:TolA-binding protein